MSRKSFMESQGATSKNDRYGWGFVNHQDKVVIFGAWDVYTQPDRSLIFSMAWEKNEKGRKQNAFTENLDYIQLVENEGYSLKTFPIILDTQFDQGSGTGRSKMKSFVEELSNMVLEKDGENYYAVGEHNPQYSTKPASSVTNDIIDIFISTVDKTEQQSLIMSRIGQGRFRKNVIDVWGNGECCALTLVDVREILIASHIVPWSVCDSNEQRLDGANGILLCAHIDRLFDSYKLTFVKHGHRYLTKLSPTLNQAILKGLAIETGVELCLDKMEPKFQNRFDDYLSHHNKIFEQKL
ncbi:HNH endonuclease signature motif containing protein [Aliiglaciecola sp. LCG003]|uniref:HNH endonuclease n=1 Tax=Aliiglaciecola sp. LCG003 TaxID=3053655 RepID=UPI002572CD24|nr:HNH endonuclease signature motif containing protein [Aliiglaciecola sp. LCG003]WJG07624.1 HNH endonuclease signature motif containing protein [Aliiglaciecola sp. LCG003]